MSQFAASAGYHLPNPVCEVTCGLTDAHVCATLVHHTGAYVISLVPHHAVGHLLTELTAWNMF